MRSILSGILISVLASQASAQATWVVDRTPILDVAGVSSDGTVIFSNAAGGMRLRDGGLLIADRGESSIRVIDAAGKLVRSVGRAGGGPGEFQSILWAGPCGADSMLVWDLSRRQASMIAPNGTIARQFAVPAQDTAQRPSQFSCSSRGAMAYRSVPRQNRDAPNAQNPNLVGVLAAVYRTGRDGVVLQRFGDIPAGEVAAFVSPSGGRGAVPRPLGRTAHVATLDDAVVISSADSALVTIVRADGRSSRHALPIIPRAPTKEELDHAVQSTASMAPPAMRQSLAQQLATIPAPERLPAISALMTDADGLVWVQTTPPGGRTVDFLVIQSTGGILARVQIPVSLTIFEIGRDYVLGSYTDAADETHVAVLRLRR